MALWLLLALFLAAQDKPPDKCTLSGSVVSSVTGEPLNRVEIFTDGGTPATTTTDAKGNFTLVDLDPGQYKLKARRNGYLDTYFGARRADGAGTPITLESGVEMKDVQIKLVPFAVLAGTVRETDGEPLAGARVDVFAVTYGSGRRHVVQVSETHADDLGQYRIANLPPGKYYISAEPHRDDEDELDAVVPEDHSPKTAAREVLLPALYPGVVNPAAAQPVEAAAGARVAGLDIALPRSRVFRVTGHVAAPAGTRGGVALEPVQEFEGLGQRYKGIEKSSGDFEIRGVPPGSYILAADAAPPGKSSPGIIFLGSWRRFRASIPLDVGDADVTGVRITVAAGPEVEGRVTVEGDPVKIDGFVDFEDSTGMSPSAPILEDQTFATLLSPGSYSVYAPIANHLVTKSIRAGQIDVLRGGLTVSETGKISIEIVLAPDGGEIEGVVLDKDEKPVAGATVLLVPDAPFRGRHDRFGNLITDQHGHYKFENVTPGDYKVFAWVDIEPDTWLDPDFFRDIESRGEPVKLSAKGHETVKAHVAENR